MTSLVSHCTSTEHTKRWDDNLMSNAQKVLCHWANLYGTQIPAWTLSNQSHAKSSLLLMRQGQKRQNNVLNFRCTGQLAQGYMVHCVPHVEDTAGFMHTQTPVRISHIICTAIRPTPTQDQLPAPEGWPDKATATISHHLIGRGEWLMKSHATAADKIRPSQVMKDRACGCEWGAGRFLGQNAAFRWLGTQ